MPTGAHCAPLPRRNRKKYYICVAARLLPVKMRFGSRPSPPVIGITNSPKTGKKRAVFPPGGHTGPPLRQAGKAGGNFLIYFVTLVPGPIRKQVYSTEILKNMFTYHVVHPRRGGPMCPPIADIMNSQNTKKMCAMLPLGGHAAPPPQPCLPPCAHPPKEKSCERTNGNTVSPHNYSTDFSASAILIRSSLK